MKVTAFVKADINRYAAALALLNAGDNTLAIQAIQLGELTTEQLKRGLVARLSHAVATAKYHNMRIAKAAITHAEAVLGAAQ